MVTTMATTLRLAATGDRAADFEAVVADESRRLYSIAICILSSPGEAEDAVQDTLELAWRKWETLLDPARRRAWLTQVCVRRCLRLRETLGRRRHLELRDEHPDSPVEASELNWDAAFTKLSVSQRAVVGLHYLHGHTLDECARLMGRRPGTARQHLARALTKLRAEMIDD